MGAEAIEHLPLCYRLSSLFPAPGASVAPGRAPVSRTPAGCIPDGVVCSSWAVGMAAGSVGEGGSKRMSQQPEFTSIPASPAPATGTAQGTVPGSVQPAAPHSGQEVSLQRHPQRIPRWLERSELFLRVLLRLYIGLAVCCAPWWPMFWDQNPLLLQFPILHQYACYGAVRGIITGLGLLNLWIAFRDAVRHRDG